MKKLLLFPLFCLALGASAQSSIQLSNYDDSGIISPNSAIMLGTNASSQTKYNIDVRNTSSSTKKYLAKRYDLTLNSGAVAYYCFAGSCYGPGTIESPDTLLLGAGQAASQNTINPFYILTADLDEGSTVGYSQVRYTFFDPFNLSDSAQITFLYNSPVGILESKKNLGTFSLYPNPSEGASNLLINAPAAFQGKVQVFNALGDLISEQNTAFTQGENKVALSLGNASAGVYLVSIRSGNSTLTKRLVIK